MMRTSELRKELAWQRVYQCIQRDKANRYKAQGYIHCGDMFGNRECYDDCMKYIEQSKETEQLLIAELQRRRELPKRVVVQVGRQVACVLVAIVTLGQVSIMQ